MDGSTQGYHMPAGEGDAWWFVDTRMTVKADSTATGGALTVIEWSAPVGFAPPLHIHPMEEKMFYLLNGSIRVVCGDREWDAGPGLPPPEAPDIAHMGEVSTRHNYLMVGPPVGSGE